MIACILKTYAATPRVRRAKRKLPYGSSIPVPRKTSDIKKDIKEGIISGKYNIGVPVLDNEKEKLVITKDGKIERKITTLTARKYPLKQIRERTLKENYTYLKTRKDEEYDNMGREEICLKLNELNEYTEEETGLAVDKLRARLKKIERTRHWLLWHDHSTISSTGFMLFLVRELYDPAIHLTDKEHQEKKGLNRAVSVQSKIERPHLYMMGASRSTDSDQLLFIPTRRECLLSFSQGEKHEDGTIIHNVMRFMNGDNPAVELEDGTQKGGHRGCAGCDADIRWSTDLELMARENYVTLEEKQKRVLAGEFGDKGYIYPFKNLKAPDLRKELDARGEETEGINAKQLQSCLTEILGGTVRVPALLFGEEQLSIKDLNLDDYEVLFFEPLHCCLNHIDHILKELPFHIDNPETLQMLKEVKDLTLSKEKLRATDYRKALLKATITLADLLTDDERDLLLSFCEMMSIYYDYDNNRTPRQVLRLYNLSLRHAILVTEKLFPPKSGLTRRKLCGMYYHACASHAPLIYRLVCLRSINAELFERFFEQIENITKSTWSRRLEDLVPNAFLHIEAERSVSGKDITATFAKQEHEISKLGKSLPTAINTTIPKQFLVKQSRIWEAHLSTISDFIKPGEGVWWEWTADQSFVVFKDAKGEPESRPEGPRMTHFRSSSLKDLQENLKTTWNKCIADPSALPVYKLRNTEGKIIYNREMSTMDNDAEDMREAILHIEDDQGNKHVILTSMLL